jgi:hypothetical protein
VAPERGVPSGIALVGVPLVGALGKAEIEHAAALIIRVCQVRGDKWQPVDAEAIGDVLRAEVDAKNEPFCSLVRNPFFRPDVWALIEKGFGRWTAEPGGAVELTQQAFDALARWVNR